MSEDTNPLTPERVKIIKKSDSKKRVIEILSELLAAPQEDINQHDIFDALIAREKLGNTLLTNGIALPRAQLNIDKPRAALVFLKKGIRLDSPDKKPTKLFLALLIPNQVSDNEKHNEPDRYEKMIKNLILELSKQSVLDDFTASKNPQILVNYFSQLLKPDAYINEAALSKEVS
jgi:mannitol/fructose-specific phosphotransferase system IIA component (Ntr-type)